MEPEYEIQTMKKDIDRLKKAAINEPISTRPSEPVSPTISAGEPAAESASSVGRPPEKLPAEKLPGAPFPSEPIVSARVELPKPQEPILPSFSSETEEPPRTKKVFIPVILVIAVLLVGAGFYYWWNYMRGPEKPAIEPPASLIEVDITEMINIKEGKEADLLNELKKKAAEFQEKNTFRRILLKKIGREKDYFLSSQEIFGALGINLSADILSNLNEDNTLFIYAQEQKNRLGIIIKNDNADNLKIYLKSWEATMVNDLKPLFLGEKLIQPAVTEFKDSPYKEVNIRYLNFIDSIFAVDYALVGDYFVITTSKESMHGVIDKVLSP